MKPLLELPEARPALLVEADDLAIEDHGGVQRSLQRRDDFRKLEILPLVVSAEQRDAFAVKPADYAQPVELGLENPIRIVEGFIHERAEHRLDVFRHPHAGEDNGRQMASSPANPGGEGPAGPDPHYLRGIDTPHPLSYRFSRSRP